MPTLKSQQPDRRGFTLIELIIVLSIFGVALGLVAMRAGVFSFWNDERFLRRLSETITFLHAQSIAEQASYELSFDLTEQSYKVGVRRTEAEDYSQLQGLTQDAGIISLELAAFLSPTAGKNYTIIPPPSFPSFAQPIRLPEGTRIEDVRTVRGIAKPEDESSKLAVIGFSPRGFSDFAVIHLRLRSGGVVTLLVNPFTGGVQIFREYRDFEWTYGRKSRRAEEP